MPDVAEQLIEKQHDKKTHEAEQLKRILRRGIASSQKFQRAVDKMPGRTIKG